MKKNKETKVVLWESHLGNIQSHYKKEKNPCAIYKVTLQSKRQLGNTKSQLKETVTLLD